MIVKFDGKPIKESRDLPRMVAGMAVGAKADVTVLRKGKEVSIPVTLGRLEDGEKQMAKAEEEDDDDDAPKESATAKALGLTLSALGDDARKSFKLKDSVKGVLVSGVEPNSPAAEKGLARRRRDRGGQPAGGRKARRRLLGDRHLEEGGQEVGAAAGRQRRRRRAFRRAGAELTPPPLRDRATSPRKAPLTAS